MLKVVTQFFSFFRKEIILSLSILLAVLSMFLIPPSFSYIQYVDWNTLALLFSLMAVVKGFQQAGLFVSLGNQLLKRTKNLRAMFFVLVFLPFLTSMIITNDVALITFVPFSLIVLRMAGQERFIIPLVVMQTIAANLGSVLTPMGNPQNLYFYSKSGMGFLQFCGIMLPYTLLSAAGLLLLILLRRSAPVTAVAVSAAEQRKSGIACYAAGFLLCLFALFDILPPVAVAAIIAVFLLLTDRKLLGEIDYSLLGTFLALFVLIGNIGNIDALRTLIASVLTEHAELAAVCTSQIISNVPAALLLSGITLQWKALIIGCNLGGLGTLIASMASLISYKMVAKEYPEHCRKYFMTFTAYNLAFLVVLLSANFFLFT